MCNLACISWDLGGRDQEEFLPFGCMQSALGSVGLYSLVHPVCMVSGGVHIYPGLWWCIHLVCTMGSVVWALVYNLVHPGLCGLGSDLQSGRRV